MKRLSVLLLWLISATTLASSPLDIFPIEKEPGSGTLQLKQGDSSRPITLGSDTGYYAFALAIPADVLPKAYQEQFRSKLILQLVMGSLRARTEKTGGQFTSATILLDRLPTAKQVIQLAVPATKDALKPPLGIWLFSPPGEGPERSDDERLKSSLFATSGTLSLSPLGPSVASPVQVKGSKVAFRKTQMRAELASELNTPFLPQASSLSGTIEFAVYSPDGKNAGALMREMAAQTLGGGKPLPKK